MLRLGDGSVATPSTGIALPLFLDEVDTTGEEAPTSVVQSIALPLSVSLAMGSTSGVAPGSSQWFDTEGFPTSFASDNSAIVVSCYSVPPGSPILDSNTTIKVVGVVRADGSMDFSSTATVFPWYGRDGFQVALRNAVTSDGSSYWLAGSPGACGYTDVSSTCLSKGGIFHVPFGGDVGLASSPAYVTTTPNDPGYYDARPLGIYAGQLFVMGSSLDSPSAEGLWSLGGGLPLTTTVPTQVAGTAGVASNPWTFVFADDNNVYIAVSRAVMCVCVALPALLNDVDYSCDSSHLQWWYW